jgi:serine/threonine protein kinase
MTSPAIEDKMHYRPPSIAQASNIFGEYRIVAQLGAGGMAEVYLAQRKGLAGFEKLVVIKKILPHLARKKSFVDMFLDEARIAAQLNHQNVVQTFDLGNEGGQYYIAMEYVEGESLKDVLHQSRVANKAFHPALAAGIALQACNGLHYAHALHGADGAPLNIVHRDVSPQNILVSYEGTVRVVDFGIATASVRVNDTRTGYLKGKYGYMSPEQIELLRVDGRSDVYSLGVVLWESIAGKRLFNQNSDLSLLKAITEQDVPSPSVYNPALAEELCRITLRALARNRKHRYQSAADLGADLRMHLKTTSGEGDSSAIRKFMAGLFSERRKRKRRVIEEALASISRTSIIPSSDASPPPRILEKKTYIFNQLTNGEEVPKQGQSHNAKWLAVLLVIAAVLSVAVVFGLLMGRTSDRDMGPTQRHDDIEIPKAVELQDEKRVGIVRPTADEVSLADSGLERDVDTKAENLAPASDDAEVAVDYDFSLDLEVEPPTRKEVKAGARQKRGVGQIRQKKDAPDAIPGSDTGKELSKTKKLETQRHHAPLERAKGVPWYR